MKHTLALILAALALSAEAQTSLPNPNVPPASNLINGKPVPMKPTLAMDQTLVLKVPNVNGSGYTVFTHLTIRARGTRAPIHLHPYGGQTCVAQGEMTLYMDGVEPARKIAGECYWMPPGRRMSGVNTGTGDAVMFDTFVVPTEDDVWQIVEPGLPFTSKQYNHPYKH